MSQKLWIVAALGLHVAFMAAVTAQEKKAESRLLGVRAVKAQVGVTGKEPKITFPGAEQKCKLGGYHGENRQEFYFDVEVEPSLKEPPTARFECEGVEIKCVWVGHTKVKLEKADGGVTFPLVFDKNNPYTLHMALRDVPEVLLYYMHKPRDRASGPWRDIPWPQDAIAAEGNLVFGAFEVFKDMKIGEKATKDFDGYVGIGGFETTCPRVAGSPKGHTEGSPHIHLFLIVPPGFRIREASHLFIDGQGRLTGKVNCSPSACQGPSRKYDRGMICAQKDFQDRVAFEFRTEEDGSLMIRRREGAVEYHLRPAGEGSFKSGCDVYKADKPLCRVVVSDDCEKGEMRIRRTYFPGGAPDEHEEVIRYDPDTSAILSPAPPDAP